MYTIVAHQYFLSFYNLFENKWVRHIVFPSNILYFLELNSFGSPDGIVYVVLEDGSIFCFQASEMENWPEFANITDLFYDS